MKKVIPLLTLCIIILAGCSKIQNNQSEITTNSVTEDYITITNFYDNEIPGHTYNIEINKNSYDVNMEVISHSSLAMPDPINFTDKYQFKINKSFLDKIIYVNENYSNDEGKEIICIALNIAREKSSLAAKLCLDSFILKQKIENNKYNNTMDLLSKKFVQINNSDELLLTNISKTKEGYITGEPEGINLVNKNLLINNIDIEKYAEYIVSSSEYNNVCILDVYDIYCCQKPTYELISTLSKKEIIYAGLIASYFSGSENGVEYVKYTESTIIFGAKYGETFIELEVDDSYDTFTLDGEDCTHDMQLAYDYVLENYINE